MRKKLDSQHVPSRCVILGAQQASKAITAGGADIVTHNVRDFTQAATFGIRLFIAARAARARKGAFRKVLDRVSKRKPLPGDQL